MFNITRDQASDILGLSLRSVDRYIKSGKLRSLKKGKIVYISEDDVSNMKNGPKKQEIVDSIPNYSKENVFTSTQIVHPSSNGMLENIYIDLKNEIELKDKRINDLSRKIGMLEEGIKNSISLAEYKKSQFLLEEGKQSLKNELDELKKEYDVNIKKEKSVSLAMMVLCLLLFVFFVIFWFTKV